MMEEKWGTDGWLEEVGHQAREKESGHGKTRQNKKSFEDKMKVKWASLHKMIKHY